MSVVIGAILSVATTANLATLYLIAVLAAARRLGRGPAIASSVAAFLVYDWFFIEPRHTFTIAEPSEWVALMVFLVTAIITSELAANERKRAEQAERREHEAVLLLDAQRLLSDPDLDVALAALAERLRTELNVHSVELSLSVGPRLHRVQAGDPDALPSSMEVLGGGLRPTATIAGGPARWIRVIPPGRGQPYAGRGPFRRSEIPIRAGSNVVGQVALVRETDAPPILRAEDQVLALIAASIGAVAQRAELREATTRAEILHRTDELKSALLAAPRLQVCRELL